MDVSLFSSDTTENQFSWSKTGENAFVSCECFWNYLSSLVQCPVIIFFPLPEFDLQYFKSQFPCHLLQNPQSWFSDV